MKTKDELEKEIEKAKAELNKNAKRARDNLFFCLVIIQLILIGLKEAGHLDWSWPAVWGVTIGTLVVSATLSAAGIVIWAIESIKWDREE